MKHTIISLCALMVVPSIAMAQLAANPWANKNIARPETNSVLSNNQKTHLHFERKKPLDVLSTPSGLREQTFKKVCSFFSSNPNNFS